MSVKYNKNLQFGASLAQNHLSQKSVFPVHKRQASFSSGNYKQRETQKKGVSTLNVMASAHGSVNPTNPYK